MTTYNFTVFPNTAGISYFDIQYFNPNLYCTFRNTSPYIVQISTDGVVTPICTDSIFAGVTAALAVYDATTIYCSDSNGRIYIVTNGSPLFITSIGDGIPIMSMTLNADKSILYIASTTKIYTMITASPDTPVELTTGFTNLQCIRFYNNILYASVNGTTLYKINTSGTIEETINLSENVSGMAIDIYGNWYVTNKLANSGISVLNTTLTDITTNLPSNNQVSNIVFDVNDNAYYLKTNTGTTSGIYKSSSAFCFNEGTKILCMNNQLVDKYIRIELLKIGDFVKTYKHGYRKVSQVIKGSFKNKPNKWNMCMYKMEKTPNNGLIKDLIVTGGHSILVDAISDEEQKRYDAMGISNFSKETIDNKHLLLACCSDQFTPMQDKEMYTYYHLLLENNDDEEERFGIWANGILTETPNVKTVNKN